MRRLAAVLALLLLAMACGSTNDADTVTATDGPEGSAAPLASGATPAPTGPSATTSGATVTGPGGVGVVPGSKDGKSATGLPLGTGSIKIGFHYSENLDTAYRALGASGTFVNMLDALKKMVTWVNAHGGLGGKKVVPVFHGTDPLVGTFPAQAEEACTHFTQDEHVFAVISGAVLPDINMPACHAKERTPLMWAYQYLLDRKTIDGWEDYLYQPHAVAIERYGFYIDALWNAKFLTKTSKVGVFRYDDTQHKRFLDTVIKPGLAKHGLTVLDKAFKRPRSAGEAGDVATQASNATVDMRAKGIDRVLFIPSGGAIPLVAGQVMNGQHYYPKLAFNSFDIPAFVTDNLTDEQLAGGMTIGWMPLNDTYIQYVGKTAARERCFAATGVRADDVVRFCDGFFLLKDALDRTPLFDVPGLKRATHALGQWTGTPWALSSKLGPNRHDGAAQYQMMRFQLACSCFRYEGSKFPIP